MFIANFVLGYINFTTVFDNDSTTARIVSGFGTAAAIIGVSASVFIMIQALSL